MTPCCAFAAAPGGVQVAKRGRPSMATVNGDDPGRASASLMSTGITMTSPASTKALPRSPICGARLELLTTIGSAS